MTKWVTMGCFDNNEFLIDSKSIVAIYKDAEKLTLDIYLKGANKDFLINYQSVEKLNKSYNELLKIIKKY